VNQPDPVTVCSGGQVAEITFGTPNTGITPSYSWQVTGDAIGLGSKSGTGSLPTFTAVNGGLSPLTAKVTVTPSNGGCAGPIKTFTITVNPVAQVNQPSPQTVCSGGQVAGITFGTTNTGITPTYSWTNDTQSIGLAASGTGPIGAFTGLNTTNAPVTATITVTPSIGGCAGPIKTFTITVNPEPVVIDQTLPTPVCSDGPLGVIFNSSSSSSVATATYTILSINTNGLIPGINNKAAGATGLLTDGITNDSFTNTTSTAKNVVYTVVPVSAAGCQGNSFTVTVTVNPKPVGIPSTLSVCSDQAFSFDPQTNITTTGGNSVTSTFAWVISSVQGTVTGVTSGQTGTGNVAGNINNVSNTTATIIYTVTPTSAAPNSCLGNPFTITLTVNPEPVVASQTPTVCSDAPLGVNFNSSTSVAAPTYNITALNLNGLTVSAGGAAVANGLTATALADDAFTNTTNAPKNVVYTVIPVSAAGCQGNSFTVTATINPEPVVINQTLPAPVCSDAPLGANFNSSTSVAAATYNVTALNLNGLSVSAGGAALANGLTAAALADDAFTNNTSAAVNVVYTVVPVSAAGCQGNSFTVTVTVNPKPAGISSNPSVCSDQGFSFDPQTNITTTGGNSVTSTFAWVVSLVQGTVTGVTSGQTGTGNVTGNINNVSTTAATIVYTVTPTSAAPNSCQGNSFTITLTVNPEPVVANQTLPTVCNNAPIGVNFNSSSSVAAATYNITDITLNGLTPAPTNKAKGTTNLPANGITNDSFTNTTKAALNVVYTIVPVSAAGCQGNSFTVTVTVKPPIAINETVSDYGGLNIACFGDTTASISLQVSGGTAPYRYAWTGPNGFTSTSANLSNLAVGSYSLIVTDAANCRLTKTYDMRGPDPIALAATISDYIGFQISCKGGSDGLIDLKITGGNGGYQIFWEGPAGFRSNLPKIEGLLPGKYEVTVIDSKNCSLKQEYTLLAPDEFLISPNDISVTQVSCFSGSNGAIAITLKKATLAPYRYEISGSSTSGLPVSKSILSNNLSYQFAGLRAGNYTLRVSDAIGCTIAISTEIKEAPIYDLTETVKNVSCFGKKDGAITVRVIGGAPPFKVQWAHGPQVTSLNNLDKGVYSVSITDTGGCTIEKQFVITEPLALDLSASVTDALDCTDQNTGSISVNPFGGTPPYTYTWSNGSKTQNLAAIGPGSYSLELVDAKGCRILKQFTINHPLPLEVSVAQTTVRVCDPRGLKSNFKVTVKGGIAPYTATWNRGKETNGGLVMDTQELGVFVVTVKDARGCTQIKRIEVLETDPLVTSFDYNSTSFDLSQENLVNFEVQFKNLSVGKYKEASWDFGDGGASTEKDPTYKYSKPGTYIVQLKLKDLTDCIVSFSKTIVITDYYLKFPSVFTPNQDGINDYFYPKFLHLNAIQVTIMNKWGELVYESKDLDAKGWDGLYNGEKAPIGNYACIVRHTTLDGRIIEQSSVFYLGR
jgi:gliding motility-associated-like protein